MEIYIDASLYILPVYVSDEVLVLRPLSYAQDLDACASYSSIGTYFEGIGVLVKKPSIHLSWMTLCASLTRFWEKHELVTKKMRRCMNYPQIRK